MVEGEHLVEVSRRGLSFALYPGIFHIPLGDKSGLLMPENFSIYRSKSCNELQCLYAQYEWLHTLMAAIAPCYCQAALPMLLLGQERNASGLSPSHPFPFLLPLVNPCVVKFVSLPAHPTEVKGF